MLQLAQDSVSTILAFLNANGTAVQTVALIATLVFLALQIRQNTDSIKLNTYTSLGEQTRAINGLLLQTLTPEELLATNGLTRDELVAFVLLNEHSIAHWLLDHSLLDKKWWDVELKTLEYLVTLPIIQRLWAMHKFRSQYTSEFQKVIDDMMPRSAATPVPVILRDVDK